MSELTLVSSLFGPLFVGLIFHGLCIKFGWLRSLAVPIDRKARFRGRALLGANKTYRGIMAVALGSAAGYSLQSLVPELQPAVFHAFPTFSLALFGFALGAAAMLSELPNSFLKRRLDIAPGTPGGGPAMLFVYIVDQVDFLLGAWLVAWPWVPPTPVRVLWSILFVLVVHQVISVLGALLGMRGSAR
jgi:CDP-archaeol synthase